MDNSVSSAFQFFSVKEAVQCSVCHKYSDTLLQCELCSGQILCPFCITRRSVKNQRCLNCISSKAKFVKIDVSDKLTAMCSCQYKEQGCEFKGTVKEVDEHVPSCKFHSLAIKKCRFCGIEVDTSELSCKAHLCGQRRLWAREEVSLFSADRIANMAEVRKLVEAFRCFLCENLLKQPMACKHCQVQFCQVCVANWILKEETCPRCERKEPLIQKVQTPAKLRRVQLYCHNDLCGQQLSYFSVEEHESECWNAGASLQSQVPVHQEAVRSVVKSLKHTSASIETNPYIENELSQCKVQIDSQATEGACGYCHAVRAQIRDLANSKRPCFVLWVFLLEALFFYLFLGLGGYWIAIILPIEKESSWRLSCIFFGVLYVVFYLTALIPGLIFMAKPILRNNKNVKCLNRTAFLSIFFQLTVLYFFLKPSYLLADSLKVQVRDFQFVKGLFQLVTAFILLILFPMPLDDQLLPLFGRICCGLVMLCNLLGACLLLKHGRRNSTMNSIEVRFRSLASDEEG